MKLGIVGLPNVGKSTLFNAITEAGAEAANYPFCTIDPNVGVVEVPDKRLQVLSDISKSKKIIPAVIEFFDIAGLVRGGELRRADARGGHQATMAAQTADQFAPRAFFQRAGGGAGGADRARRPAAGGVGASQP